MQLKSIINVIGIKSSMPCKYYVTNVGTMYAMWVQSIQCRYNVCNVGTMYAMWVQCMQCRYDVSNVGTLEI